MDACERKAIRLADRAAALSKDPTAAATSQDFENKLLEVLLLHSPFLAEEMFKRKKLTNFDKNKVAKLCERVGLKHRAL